MAVRDTFRDTSLQLDAELDALIALFIAEDVRSFLEIGSKWGGTIWRVANAMPSRSRVVSVDLNQNGSSLHRCIVALRDAGYVAALVVGVSQAREVVKQAAGLGPYDAILIDGDHSEAGVEADWTNYGPMGRMICFHDIGWRKPSAASPRPILGPATVWNRVRGEYRHLEIMLDPEEAAYGIGVLWRI